MDQEVYEILPNYLQHILNVITEQVDNGKWLELDEAIELFHRSSFSWLYMGAIAQVVKELKIYQGKFKTFKDFCEKALDRSRSYIERLIKASKIVIELAQMGFSKLPVNEAQARPLTKYQGDELADRWNEVIHTIPSHLITAEIVEERMDEKKEYAYRSIKIPRKVWDEFEAKVLDKGGNPKKELEKLLGEWEPEEETQDEEVLEDEIIEPVTVEQVNRWLDDLENLCASYDLQQLQRLYNTE
ncbi:DNA modification methylase family protein [Aphanothece sacrum FPU1]|nr:DNA modification methylase family protein [Aphanothece sacrum FPU1]GBF86422.1 DNA modification methylase family protein [Aphanothece sacrum FPU3]GBF87172.1 DNA modification methylase family protein [Aphanothece sacrum FPU3]